MTIFLSHPVRPILATLILLSASALSAWAQSCINSVWSQSPASGPSARSDYGVAYDTARGRTVLFGGYSGTTNLADTWEFNGSTWVSRPVVGPAPRNAHNMVYDSVRGRIVLFGGTAAGTRFGDTWEYDGNSWTLRANSGPAGRALFGMSYDSVRAKTIVYGGNLAGNGTGFDTWEYDGAAAVWTQRIISNNPGPRIAHSMTFDPIRGRTVLVGGQFGSNFSDTWEYNSGIAEWVRRATTGPTGIAYSAVAFDAGRQRVVSYGGHGIGDGVVGGTFEWDGNAGAWIDAGIADPGSRSRHKLAYDSARQKLVTFGGVNPSFVAQGSTWELSCGQVVSNTSFNDAFLANGSWQTSIIYDTSPNRNSSSIGWQVLTGGNTGSFRNVRHVFAGTIGVAHMKSGAAYTPALSGELGSLDISFDLKITLAPGPGAGVAYSLLLKQNNSYYSNGWMGIYALSWQRFAASNLKSWQFAKVGGTGPAQPDFSATAPPIELGYGTFNSAGNLLDSQLYTIESGLDNWTVIAHPVAYADDTFANADWQSAFMYETSPGQNSSFAAAQSSTGGNPGTFRNVVHTFGGAISIAHIKSGSVYFPARDGLLASIDAAYDLLITQAFAPTSQVAYTIVLRQNGVYYAGGWSVIGVGPWQRFSTTGLTAAGFARVLTASPYFDSSSHPDFSASGAPIEFGYATYNSAGDLGDTQLYTMGSGIDNWSITLNAAAPNPCTGDFNGDGTPTVQDLFDFIAAYFSGDPRADINTSGAITVQDIFDFIAAYFAGCP